MQKFWNSFLNFCLIVCVLGMLAIGIYYFSVLNRNYDYAQFGYSNPENATVMFLENGKVLKDYTPLIIGNTYTYDVKVHDGYKLERLNYNDNPITVPFEFIACNDMFFECYVIKDEYSLTIRPSEPSLVGWNVKVTAIGADCMVENQALDCTVHSPCLVEDCEHLEVVQSIPDRLTANEETLIYLVAGYANDLYSAKLLFIPPEGYTIDSIEYWDITKSKFCLSSGPYIIITADSKDCYYIYVELKEK